MTTNFNSLDNYYSKKLVDDLEGFLVKTFETEHWHCYHILDKSKPLSISIYDANKKAEQVILSSCNNIYLEMGDSTFVGEDICFFSNNGLFLGSVSHAGICNLFPKSNDD